MPNKQQPEPQEKSRGSAGNTGASDMTAQPPIGFNTLASFSTQWVETLGEMGSEVLSFVAERVREDVKTQHELLHCDDIEEMREIQARFLRRTIEQYTRETGKLIEIGNRFRTSD